METAGFPPQVVVLAVTVNGEVSVAPFEGEATLMFVAVDAAATVMFNSVSAWTFLPQHFTCRMCDPEEAETDAENDVGSITAVLLSSE